MKSALSGRFEYEYMNESVCANMRSIHFSITTIYKPSSIKVALTIYEHIDWFFEMCVNLKLSTSIRIAYRLTAHLAHSETILYSMHIIFKYNSPLSFFLSPCIHIFIIYRFDLLNALMQSVWFINKHIQKTHSHLHLHLHSQF